MQRRWGGVAGLAVLFAAGICFGTKAAQSFDNVLQYRALIIDGSQVRWANQQSNTPLMLRYAIANGDVVTEDAINCGHIRQPSKLLSASGIDRGAFRAATREGFARWQQVANIVFVEMGSVENADIVVGEQAAPQGIAFTNITIGDPIDASARAIKKAQICLNPSRKWKVGFDGNIAVHDLAHVITHEIGHAIGLDHPSARGQIMSFRYQETLDGLTDGDRLGAVALYGHKPTSSSAAQHAGRFVSRDDAPSTH